jgi:nucleoside-diphosphate-sugar epimerase
VHTSTSEVYGTAQYKPIDEKHPVVGQSPYSASKIGADHLAESFYRSFDLPVSIIRPFNTFGPRQSARAVIPTIITQALSDAETIRLGSLSPVRDLNYVKDTVEGFLAVAASEKTIGKVTNVGRGEGISIGDLAQKIVSICGSSAGIETDSQRVRPEKSEVFELVCDNNRAQDLLGWQPRYTLDEGLEETVEWIRSRLHHYKSGIYNV